MPSHPVKAQGAAFRRQNQGVCIRCTCAFHAHPSTFRRNEQGKHGPRHLQENHLEKAAHLFFPQFSLATGQHGNNYPGWRSDVHNIRIVTLHHARNLRLNDASRQLFLCGLRVPSLSRSGAPHRLLFSLGFFRVLDPVCWFDCVSRFRQCNASSSSCYFTNINAFNYFCSCISIEVLYSHT